MVGCRHGEQYYPDPEDEDDSYFFCNIGSWDHRPPALEALDVKVYATRDSVNIQGIIPVDLVTIEQTSGCQLIWTKCCPGKEEPIVGVIA